MFDKFFKKHQFKDSEKQAVFTCCHIIEEHKPILYVKHNCEGDWQFLCGASHTTEEARIISLAEALQLDPDISLAANLKRGQTAQRKSKDDKWKTD